MEKLLSLIFRLFCACSIAACTCCMQTAAAESHDCCPSETKDDGTCECPEKIAQQKNVQTYLNGYSLSDVLPTSEFLPINGQHSVADPLTHNTFRICAFEPLFKQASRAPPA